MSGTKQTISLTGAGSGLPTASVNPSALGYTDQNVGTTSTAQVVTLTNTGTGVLTIAGITLNGTNPGDFVQTHTCATTLAAAASCTISVTFKPTLARVREANLVITDNTGGITGSTQNLTLFGIGH